MELYVPGTVTQFLQFSEALQDERDQLHVNLNLSYLAQSLLL